MIQIILPFILAFLPRVNIPHYDKIMEFISGFWITLIPYYSDMDASIAFAYEDIGIALLGYYGARNLYIAGLCSWFIRILIISSHGIKFLLYILAPPFDLSFQSLFILSSLLIIYSRKRDLSLKRKILSGFCVATVEI